MQRQWNAIKQSKNIAVRCTSCAENAMFSTITLSFLSIEVIIIFHLWNKIQLWIFKTTLLQKIKLNFHIWMKTFRNHFGSRLLQLADLLRKLLQSLAHRLPLQTRCRQCGRPWRGRDRRMRSSREADVSLGCGHGARTALAEHQDGNSKSFDSKGVFFPPTLLVTAGFLRLTHTSQMLLSC